MGSPPGGNKQENNFLIVSVMIFKEVLTDTNAVNGLPPLLDKLPVPEFVILVW
jgi:hypothetical protein